MNHLRMQSKIEKLVAKASFSLRADVLKLLRIAYSKEKNKRAKKALGWILENAKIAKKEGLAICQDTGIPIVFIEAGKNVKVSSGLVEAIKEGVERGYRKSYLRPSVVDPLRRAKPSYQGGVFHLDFNVNLKGLKITIFPKGFGSENKSAIFMFKPTVSLDEIRKFILECVEKAGPEGCPPFIVGVGIGGTADTAALLAKKALLEKIDKPNPDRNLNKLEKKWLKNINSLKIGAMGLGGNTSCLAVKMKLAPTHIAGLPVAVNISCHALRSASIKMVPTQMSGFR